MIDKVGGAIVLDHKILVVRKKTKENFEEYIIPGGKREAGENDLETLSRELKEELSVNILTADYMGEYQDIAVFEKVPITIRVYLTQISGTIDVQNEIKEYCWIDREYKKAGIRVGSILEKYVIPELVYRGIL